MVHADKPDGMHDEVGTTHKYNHTRFRHVHTHTIHPSIHLLLVLHNDHEGIGDAGQKGKELHCSRSGSAEMPVVMKSLLVEHLMTKLTWDPCSGRVTTLMVDQTCLVQSLEGAARMIPM